MKFNQSFGGLKVLAVLALSASAAVLSSGCVDNNNSSTTGPDTSITSDTVFLGYSNVATHQTTCGNCHVDKQRDWAQTKHANAWADMENSGHAASYCYKCHSTNGGSNLAPDSAGFFAVKDNAKPLYHDVQCESCHGPGAGHVSAPDDAQPLSTIVADTGLNTGCGTCHSGAHDPFVEEWRSSGHGFVESHAVGNVACQSCHDGRAALARFDTKAAFIEQNSSNWTAITCAVCHDPHGSKNPAQLRYPIDTPDLSTNLCMQCHYRRAVPDPTSTRLTPHSPEGPLLLSEAGWVPQNFAYDSGLVSSHASDNNPRLCAGCHVNSYSVTDKLTNQTVYTMGHRFEATPCVTAGGAPDTVTSCAESSQSFRACTAAGCHATESAARGAFDAASARMKLYADLLWVDSNANSAVDTTDGGLVAQAKRKAPNDFKAGNVVTVGMGAAFNAALIRLVGTPAHNPFYAEALAISTINAIKAQYALPVPPAVETMLRTRAAAVGLRSAR